MSIQKTILVKTILTILVCACFVIACDDNDNAKPSETGKWILYEQGYSPGVGYITEDIPLLPAQTLLLNEDGSLETTVKGWEKYKHYLILEQGVDENKILALYEEKPLTPNPDRETLAVSYTMEFDEDGNLKLFFRWCDEGCHLAFRKYLQ